MYILWFAPLGWWYWPLASSAHPKQTVKVEFVVTISLLTEKRNKQRDIAWCLRILRTVSVDFTRALTLIISSIQNWIKMTIIVLICNKNTATVCQRDVRFNGYYRYAYKVYNIWCKRHLSKSILYWLSFLQTFTVHFFRICVR